MLSGWLRSYPLLNDAYAAKEAFFDVYAAETREEAERRYEAWHNGIPESIAGDFAEVVRAVDNWHPYVMSYFDHRVTNAFSESINNLIRLMNRLGRGYSFEALRAKVLYTNKLHKTKKPRLVRRNKEVSAHYSMMLSREISPYMNEPTNEASQDLNFGVDIPTLISLLEDERF